MRIALLMLGILLVVAACTPTPVPLPPEATYTLLRSSVLDSLARIHVATFDAADGENYNAANCDLVRQLMQAQPGVTTHFWCEKGRYHK